MGRGAPDDRPRTERSGSAKALSRQRRAGLSAGLRAIVEGATMIRLTQAIVAVMSCTVATGVAGGIVGVSVGTFAPSFVVRLQKLPGPGAVFDSAEFGLGLGIVSGLLFGE